jgi:hypothetical protein
MVLASMESLELMRADLSVVAVVVTEVAAVVTEVAVVLTEILAVVAEVRDAVLVLRAILVQRAVPAVGKEDPGKKVTDPDRRATDPELRVELAVVREDPDLPELREVKALLLRVVTRVSSTVRERKESREVNTASRVRRESSSIPSTEKTVLEEAEATPRVVMARVTGAPLRMRLRSLLRMELRMPPPNSLLLRSPRLRKSLRRRRKLQLRLESLLRTISMLRNLLSLSTWLRRRSQLSRRKVEPTRTILPRRLVSRLLRPPETELRPLLTPLRIRRSTTLLSARLSSPISFPSRLRRIKSTLREVTEVIDAVAVVAAVVAVLLVAPESVVENTTAEVPESRNSELTTSLPSSEDLKE